MGARQLSSEDVFAVERFLADIDAFAARNQHNTADVAAIADLDWSTLRVCRARRRLSLPTAVRLARYADLSLDRYTLP